MSPLPMMLDVTLKIGNPPAQVTGRGVNSLWTGSVRASGPVEDPALEGELRLTHSGNGFVMIEKALQDVFISRDYVGNALDGDRV
ncbi:MAG: hypothetical protein CVU72_02280, partial [Deltaproteobacteria bacterium HGW-Deltaproteobacteria-7]